MLDEIGALEDVNHGRQGKFFEHFAATEFFYRADGVAAVGLNSEPDITPRQIEMAMQHFNKGPVGEYRIFCAHHSFLPVPTKKLKPGDVVPRAADILQTLIELNVDLLCCGHIHRSHAGIYRMDATACSVVTRVPCWTRQVRKITATWKLKLNMTCVSSNARFSQVGPRCCTIARVLANSYRRDSKA